MCDVCYKHLTFPVSSLKLLCAISIVIIYKKKTQNNNKKPNQNKMNNNNNKFLKFWAPTQFGIQNSLIPKCMFLTLCYTSVSGRLLWKSIRKEKARIELETKKCSFLSKMLFKKKQTESSMTSWRSCALDVSLDHILSHEHHNKNYKVYIVYK